MCYTSYHENLCDRSGEDATPFLGLHVLTLRKISAISCIDVGRTSSVESYQNYDKLCHVLACSRKLQSTDVTFTLRLYEEPSCCLLRVRLVIRS
jgi:hypothetical protein